MNQDLFFDNKKYISVKEASSLTGYSKDYIGQLCRGNKVDSKRIGRVWYVTHDSILSHKNSGAKIEQVAEPSLKESRTDEIEKTIEPKDISADFSPTLPLSSFSLLPKQVAVFVLGLVLTTGAVLLKDDILASESSLPSLVNLQNLSKNISSAPNDFYQAMREVSDFYSKELGSRYISWGENLRKTSFSFGEEFYTAFQNPPLYIKEKIVRLSLAERKLVRENFSAASYFTNLEDYGHLDGAGLAVYNGVNNFFNNFVYSRLASFFKTPEIVANEIIPLAKNSSTLGELGVPPAPSVGKGRSPTLGVTNNVIQKVIERIIEKPIAGFLTQASLDTQLEILSNKLLSQMTVQFSGLSTGRGGSITNVYQQIAQSQKIDNLYNTTLTNANIISGSISGVSLSATTGSFGSNVSVGGNFSVTGANTTLTNLTITGTTSSQSATTTILFADTFTGYTTRVTNLTATGTVAFPNISINSLLSTNANGQLSATSTPTFGHFNATSTVATSTIATGGLVVGASQFIIQQSSGRIGIGTTSPTANIEILQTGNGNTILSAYRVTDTNPSGDFINYKTKAGTTLFRVDNSGNLLAGGIINSGSQTITSVSTPQFRVQYDSSNEWTASTNAVGSTTFATNGANSSLNFIPQNNQTQAFTFQNAAGTNIFNIDTTNGRIGIGSTTPGYRLSVAGSGFFDGGTVTASVFTATSTLSVTGATTLTGLLSFVNASGTQLTTTNSTYLATTGGNVGIGTTSPTFKLDVMGNAYFSGTGYFGGAITGTSTLSVEGNTTLGNATTTDVVNINSRLSSSLFPTSDNLLDFGDSSNWLRWRTGYFGTSIGIAGTATSTGTQLTTSGNYLLDTAGTLSLNTTNNSAINLGTGLLSLTRATTTNITATGSAYFATASGNVGIGTVGPGYKLEVVSAATTPAAATFRTSGFADYNVSTVYLQDDTAQAAGVGGRLAFRGLNDVGAYTSFGTIQGAKLNGTAGNNAGVLIFSTQVNGGSVTEKMRIDNLGNVGIGTTSPTFKLDVAGSGYFSSSLFAGGAITGTSTLNITGLTTLGNATSSSLTVTGGTYLATTAGNVGIGTTTPTRLFNLTNAGATDQFLLENTGAAANQHYATIGFSRGLFSINTMTDALATTSRMVIDTNGNVGIGTTGPGGTLDIDRANASSITAEQITFRSQANTQTLTDGTALTDWRANQFLTPTVNGVAAGGTESITNLANVYIEGAPSGSNISNTNEYALWVDGGTSRFDGNVGIGTTSPTFKLDVAGSGYFSSSLFAGGAITGTSTLNITGLTTLGNATSSSLTVTGGTYLATTAGNVGIGTTGPTAALDVRSTISIGANAADAGDIRLANDADIRWRNAANSANIEGLEFTSGNVLKIAGSTGITAVTINDDGADTDFRIESDTNASHFVSDAGLFSGVGGFGLGAAADAGTFVWINPPAVTKGGSASSAFAKLRVGDSGTVTVPDGTSGRVTTAYFDEPNLTLAGSYTGTAATVLISGAPTEGAINAALYIESGNTILGATSGNVGIGTTSPTFKLDVAGSGYFSSSLFAGGAITGTSTLNITGLATFVSASTTNVGSTGSAYFATSNGNVGIGEAGPETLLQVTGAPISEGTILGQVLVKSAAAYNASPQAGIIFKNRYNAAADSAYMGSIRVGKTTTGDGNYGGFMAFDTRTHGSVGAERMRIDTDGNVGIGTTSPTFKLDVAGSGYFSSSLFAGGAITGTSTLNITGLATFVSASTTNVGSTGSAYFATSNGNVGIGTTGPITTGTTVALTVSTAEAGSGETGGIHIRGRDIVTADFATGLIDFWNSSNRLAVIRARILNSTGNSGILTFDTMDAGTLGERMRITSTGNVGIGTTSPWRVLSTVGTVGFSSTLSTESGSDNYLCMDPITFEVTDGGATCGASSQRYKENISPIAYGLADVLKLNPVSYTYKPNINPDGELKLGFIAEEMFTILPEIVELNSDGLPESVDYAKLTAVLTKAMQEQASGFVVNFDQNAQNIPISGTSTAHMAIMGHCVTGDTLLPIRRRKKRKQGDEESDEEKDWEYLMMPIKNILVGDEVLSLNKDNGQVEYHTIKGLMDMGVKKVYKLTTVSGRVIRTTSTHPYLVASVPKFDSKTSPIIVLKMMTRKLTGVIKNVSEYITNSILPPKISETRAILTGQGRDTKTENLLGAGGKFNTLPSSPSMGSNSDFKTQGELGVPPAPGVGNAIQKENASLTKDAFSSMLYSTTRNSTGTGMLESIANDNELSMSISVDNLVKPSEGIEPSEHGIPVPVLHQADGIDLLYHQTDTEDNGNGTETTPIRNSRAADICPYCLTKDFVKRGTRKNKNQVVQLYLCRNFGCGRTFTAQDVKGKHFPLHIVIESMSYYNLGFTLEDTCRIIKKKFGVAPEPATLSDWINEYKSLCRYERLRPYAIKMFRPKDMVEVTTMAHRQLYRFRYHRAKTILMLDEFKNRALTPLKDYLDNITAETPHQYFQDGERMSEIRSKFDKADMIVKSKFNYANRLTAFVLQSIPENKERHEILQRFMIANDSCTVATEVPVYIRREDVEHLENELKFNIAGPEGVEFKKRKGDELPKGKATSASGRRFPKLLTGHIDFVQIRNGCIHILDYKPNASKEKPIEQLTWYALALSRLTGLRIFNFVCAWFDEKDYFQFYPLHVVKKLSGKKRRIVHYRSGEVAEVPRVNELTVIPRSTSPPQDTS